MNTARAGRITRSGSVRALFQPIERLATGDVVGFEALARLSMDGEILPPAVFLAHLSQSELIDLFCAMSSQALSLLRSMTTADYAPYVSVNIEPSTLLSQGFVERLEAVLIENRYDGGFKLALELLEGDRIPDLKEMNNVLARLRAMGIAVMIDDVGSAYASLAYLRELSVDAIKLDQAFARRLDQRPGDLHFTMSLQSLARGLGKRLIVEGVETPEIHDALRVLGVEFGQGYGIARPMPACAIGPWLAARVLRDPDPAPTSLLGAYAGHLKVVETCRTLMEHPLPVSWLEEAKDPHACSIGRYFDRHGLHGTLYGEAHKAFHIVIGSYATDMPSWQAGADRFKEALRTEILSLAYAEGRCSLG